jgi:hypothetical protein
MFSLASRNWERLDRTILVQVTKAELLKQAYEGYLTGLGDKIQVS